MTEAQHEVPRHLAIIMDGNGRWARRRGLLRFNGHQAGAAAVRRVVEAAVTLGVEILTLFAFSSENWNRPMAEVSALLRLFARTLESEADNLLAHNVHLRVLGSGKRFPVDLLDKIARVEEKTAHCDGMRLNIAADYGGRFDIVQAMQKLGRKIEDGSLAPEAISEALITENLLETSDIDLLIRTGGEQRISNFLLWQSAYAELYFTDTLWPDFADTDINRALEWFRGRERRFGLTPEQIHTRTGH